MRKIRVIGNTIKRIAEEKKITIKDLAEHTGCSIEKTNMGLCGRSVFSFEQLEQIATFMKVDLNEIIPGDEELYNASYVDCMNSFSDVNNMDTVLDIVYDYLDVLDAVKN